MIHRRYLYLRSCVVVGVCLGSTLYNASTSAESGLSKVPEVTPPHDKDVLLYQTSSKYTRPLSYA